MQAKPPSKQQFEPTIGIITALPKEFAAVKVMLENPEEGQMPGKGAGRRYLLGQVPAANGGKHSVVLSLAGMGTNVATTRAARLLEHFPSVEYIIMVGIAGGVPYPEKPDDHIRLGDIVVSNGGGVIQYDFDKQTYDYEKEKTKITRRPLPRPPSSVLLEAVDLLEASRLEGKKPWLAFIPLAQHLENAKRPSEETDVLTDSNAPDRVIEHPVDPKRIAGHPRVFYGPIASANKLLKDPKLRDELRYQYRVKAVEMEASGIAEATWNLEAGYLVVRGICDYCDSRKNDDWQGYAAVAAAAYTRALLESIPGQIFDTEADEEGLQSPGKSPGSTENNSMVRKRKVVHVRELLKQHFDSPTDLEELCQDLDLDMQKMRRGVITEFILDIVNEARRRRKLDEILYWAQDRGIWYSDEIEVELEQPITEEFPVNVIPDVKCTPENALSVTPNDLGEMRQRCINLIQYNELVREIEAHFSHVSTHHLHCIVLYDRPMTEKTRVLSRLFQVLNDAYVPLLVTIQGTHLSKPDYFFTDFASQLTSQFNAWARRNELNLILDTPNWNNDTQSEATFHRYWANLREKIGKRKPVVMFDEIECLLDQPQKLDTRIITFLDHFVRNPNNGYFILACFENFKSSGNERYNLLVDMGAPFYIHYLGRETVISFFSIVQDYLTFEIGVLDYLVALCDGHPSILRSMLEVIISTVTKLPGEYKIERNDLGAIEADVINQTGNTLEFLFQRLPENEQHIARLISQNSNSPRDLGYHLKELVELDFCCSFKSMVGRDDLIKGINGLEMREMMVWENEDKDICRFKLGILLLWLRYYHKHQL